jgi:hypothetical protein
MLEPPAVYQPKGTALYYRVVYLMLPVIRLALKRPRK